MPDSPADTRNRQLEDRLGAIFGGRLGDERLGTPRIGTPDRDGPLALDLLNKRRELIEPRSSAVGERSVADHFGNAFGQHGRHIRPRGACWQAGSQPPKPYAAQQGVPADHRQPVQLTLVAVWRHTGSADRVRSALLLAAEQRSVGRTQDIGVCEWQSGGLGAVRATRRLTSRFS